MSEEMPMLQSVDGRWCDRSIDDMEHAALVYITKEVHNSFGDNGLVALLADYVRMGREYGDMMNSDSDNIRIRNMKLRVALEKIANFELTEFGGNDDDDMQDIAEKALEEDR